MEVTFVTRIIAGTGLVIMALLAAAQLLVLLRPRAPWVVRHILGGSPDATDARAYYAFYLGLAWADVALWMPLQVAGSLGMLSGLRWGFLLGLAASVPYWYSAVPLLIWDRHLGFTKNTAQYWFSWGMFPVYGIVLGLYCLLRLL